MKPSPGWRPRALGEFLAAPPARAAALVTPTRRLNYGELRGAAHGVARAMHGLGLRRGDRAAVLTGGDEYGLALFYGAALLGLVTVALDARVEAAVLGFCLKQAGCRALFVAPGAAPRLPLLEHTVVSGEDSWREFAALDRGQRIAATVKPDDLLLVRFTSGAAARPKGVMLTHDNLLRNAWATGERVGVQPEDRLFDCRLSFDVGGSALACLVHGACLVTLPAFEAGAALEMMERERCTLACGDDASFRRLLRHPDLARRRLRLRGGRAAAGPQTMRRIIDELGAKHTCAAYGLAEASGSVAMSDWRDPEALRVQGLATPLPGVQLRTLDGEIQVRGWSVMRGYYNDPGATARAFTGDGWLRTGERGELRAGGRLHAPRGLQPVKEHP